MHRRTARSSITPRCCRCTVGHHRSTGRSPGARPRPASPSSGRTRASMKVRSCCRRRSTSVRMKLSATSISRNCSRSASMRCSSPWISCVPAKHRRWRRITPRRPTRAGSSATTPSSISPSRSATSTTSSAPPTRLPAPGPSSRARNFRSSTPPRFLATASPARSSPSTRTESRSRPRAAPSSPSA